MSTYTVTTGNAGAPADYAALGVRAAADVFNINGGYLKVDVDTRYGLNGIPAAQFSNIVMSASLGGTILFDSRYVRCIPFSGGSGVVPANDAAITQGSASGKLIGVYSALNAAPLAPAAAMPATGFIKIRAWNSVSFTAAALSGITATGSADGPGWLEIVGLDASTATVNRLNQFLVRGDYYTFQNATTDGTRATTYQLPTNGSSVVYVPGVEVETGTGTGVYDFYPCAGTRTALLANIATDEVRGKWCWIAAGTGLVRFGHDGTNATGGFIPPAGRKIRVPNIFFVCSISAASVNVLPNATLATRYEFATTGGGVVDIDKASCNWYTNFAQAFSITLTNTNTFDSLTLSECASPIAWSNVGVGQSAANTQYALVAGLNFAGGTMDKCTWTRAAQAASGAYVESWADCTGFTVTNARCHSLTKAANASTGSMSMTRVVNSNWTNSVIGGGQVWENTNTDVNFYNTTYYDHPALTTGTAIPFYAFSMASNCLRCKVDGVSFGGLTLVQPYAGILNILAAGCTDTKLRNLGTSAAPLDMGGAEVEATWTQATTTASATKVAHGLKVGGIIYVIRCSGIASIPIGAKTVVAITSADIFTFACTTGSLTGTLAYYPTMTASLLVMSAGAAANTVKVQRCYVPHLRSVLKSGDNSSKNITFESVRGDNVQAQLMPELNATMKMTTCTPALTAQTSVYGTHWFDIYTTDGDTSAATAWARSSTTATITKTGHGLRTGDLLNVPVSSDIAAIVRGQKSITVLTSNTFTFTCLAAGATSGTLTYVPMNGRVAIQMNEPTADTASQVALINGAAFTSAGGLYMPVIGHQADFTAPYNILGHGAFPIAETVMAGGTIANYDVAYSLDGGSTYSNLYYPRAGGSGSSAALTFTVTSGTGVAIGDYVWGTGIAPNAKVTNVATNTITVDIANTATVSGVIRFNHLPSETVSAATGFPLKLRIKTTTTNATAITSLYFFTLSTVADRGATYALDTATVSMSGLVAGSRVKATKVSDGAVLFNGPESGGSISFQTEYLGSVNLEARKASSAPYYQPYITQVTPISGSTVSATALQQLDE